MLRPAVLESRAGIAFVDVSTGEFSATQFDGDDIGMRVFEELAQA